MKTDKNQLSYLRVVTNNYCNFNCFFCHKEGEDTDSNNLETEILYKTVIENNNQINKIKITGGEPLLRDDLATIIINLQKISKAEISLTTNGYLLEERIEELKNAGLQRINVSLHSLNQENFKMITGVDGLNKVLKGIKKSMTYFKNIKINTVISKDNIHELPSIIEYCKENNLILRPMRLLPLNEELKTKTISDNELIDYLRGLSNYESEDQRLITFYINGAKVEYKKMILMDKCHKCAYLDNCGEGIYAIRLSTNGQLKRCLYNCGD